MIGADAGEVLVNGTRVTGPGPERAIVFQQPTLLPWANVLTSVAFGLQLRGVSKTEREEIARGLIKTVGLEGFEEHFPRQLSGGMQQRVGLARALAVDSADGRTVRRRGRADAATAAGPAAATASRHTQKTIVFVTHDIDEAVSSGDRYW